MFLDKLLELDFEICKVCFIILREIDLSATVWIENTIVDPERSRNTIGPPVLHSLNPLT